jgi:hypothetical protein
MQRPVSSQQLAHLFEAGGGQLRDGGVNRGDALVAGGSFNARDVTGKTMGWPKSSRFSIF